MSLLEIVPSHTEHISQR